MTTDTTERDVLSARNQVEQLEKQRAQLTTRERRLKTDLNKSKFQEWCHSAAISSRDFCKKYHLWNGGVLVVVPCVTAALSFIAIHIVSGDTTLSIMAAALSVLVTLGVLTGLLTSPSDEFLKRKSDALSKQISELARESDILNAQIVNLGRSLDEAKAYHERIRDELEAKQKAESLNHRCRQLFRRNWRAMRSVEFEQYLEEVLTTLGYEVEQTKITGDQGVDLVVVKNGYRIAIQVKGYVSSVGNAAIQQAYAGMAHYSCHGCAAITNSRYTSAAEGLAQSTNCLLIHEDNFREFVFGKLDIAESLRQSEM